MCNDCFVVLCPTRPPTELLALGISYNIVPHIYINSQLRQILKTLLRLAARFKTTKYCIVENTSVNWQISKVFSIKLQSL